MGLHESKIGLVIRMALLLEHSTAQKTHGVQQPVQPHFLFSTLRLPVPTSLPAHISAPWAISSSRQYIIFEPPDSTGNRVPQAAFNNWILGTLVPPLYISAIHEAATARTLHLPKNPLQWWPVNDSAGDNNSISRVIVEAFYNSIPQSSIHSLLGKATTVDELRFVNPSFMREVLQSRTTKFAQLFSSKHILITMVDAVLLFLLKGGISVSDLPLLVKSDGTLTHGNSQCPIKYVLKGVAIPDIFPHSDFLHENMDEETQNLLIRSTGVNVRLFDASGAIELVKKYIQAQPRCTHSSEVQQWITRFWEIYRYLPGPPAPSSLDSLPLIPTASGEYISLQYCRRDDVITEPGRPALVSAMRKLAIVFCRVPEPLRATFDKPFNLQSFLNAIRLQRDPFDGLSSDETREIRDWVRSDLYTCTSTESRTVVKGLPIWEARQNNRTVLIEASRLEMLPIDGLDSEIFDGFTRSETAIANYNPGLETVLFWAPQTPRVTSERLAQLLFFPDFLHPSNMDRYSALLAGFLNIGGQGMIPVPDGNCRLRPVNNLYDHSVELFATALQSFEQSLFLHPDFRHMQPQLRSKGLHSQVDWESFLHCANTVDDDLVVRGLPEAQVMPRAEVVCAFYNSSLPRIVMGKTLRWTQLNSLRFVPRKEIRSPSASYITDAYCERLPQIVAPSQILLQKYEQIAWTQRALCQEEPTGDLTALNKSFGVPTAAEVVQHLVILTQKVARDHPQNRTLIQQIRATYEWLNNNKEAARVHLLCTPVAFFLNVDDPTWETWEWRTAAQILFDIEYDFPETNTFRARRFLQDYRPLLLAAGAGVEHNVEYKPKTRAPDGNILRDSFDAMRKAGQLTDTVLMPITDEDIDEESLRAHSAFLAAAIPHVRAGLSDWVESQGGKYSFPGSYFGALAILDFVYTGRIERSAETDDGHMELLRDLLELLPVADQWELVGVKDEIGRLIRDKKLLSRDTYWMIMKRAEDCGAASLVEYCQEWGRANPKSVPDERYEENPESESE
ncbi:hypothetical protein MSAN_01049400 [Mycena sanguinolenta]|uniref:BTB domain-containing protein n=1 Tax=Mycena sanguinolenta TaxID=230812 RepID=A0A8H7D9K6_9AGAR|nr:hypothetical protein MSAN_01049400 [Mycena sanguinolenta]